MRRHTWSGPCVRIRFERGAVLAGRVEDIAGRPATAFTLALLLAERADASAERRLQQDQYIQREYPFETAEGRFELSGLAADSYDLLATALGGRGGRMGPITLRAGEEKRDVRVVLEEGAVVKGRVLDAETGAPVAGARLLLDTPGKSPRTTTEADGSFRLGGTLVEQRLRLDVRGPSGAHAPRVLFIRVPKGTGELDVGAVELARVSRP
jgi:hypothetical protein